MVLDPILQQRRNDILRIAERHGAFNVRVFGSAARGEAGPESDLDILVDVRADHSSWFPAGLILDLEDLLRRKVDVVTEAALFAPLRQRIMEEAVPL